MTRLAQTRMSVALVLGTVTIGPLGFLQPHAQAQDYPRETANFCSHFVAGAPQGDPQGPVTFVYAYPTGTINLPQPANADIKYAEFSSESISDANQAVPNLPPTSRSSVWTYVRGRWPIKRTKRLVASSSSTTAILEHQEINGYKRHRVYVRGGGGHAARVWVQLHINKPPQVGGEPPVREIIITDQEPANTWRYVETELNTITQQESISEVKTAGPTELAFVNAIHNFAETTKGFDTIQNPGF